MRRNGQTHDMVAVLYGKIVFLLLQIMWPQKHDEFFGNWLCFRACNKMHTEKYFKHITKTLCMSIWNVIIYAQ